MIANDNISRRPLEQVEARPPGPRPDWFDYWRGRRILRLANDNARGQGRPDQHDVAAGRKMGTDLGKEGGIRRSRMYRRARQLLGRLLQMHGGRRQIGRFDGRSDGRRPVNLVGAQ